MRKTSIETEHGIITLVEEGANIRITIRPINKIVGYTAGSSRIKYHPKKPTQLVVTCRFDK